jgi:hypothetical protein
MLALILTILIDASIVKIYDLIDKNFLPLQSKLALFSINSSLCLAFQFFILKYLHEVLRADRLNRPLKGKPFYLVSLISLCILTVLMGFLIFQLFYFNYYFTLISILVISISYGTAAALLIWLSILFLSWYKSNHNLIVLLYFISMSFIAFNLIAAAAFTSTKVDDRPSRVGPFVGGAGDFYNVKYQLLDNVYRISSFMSFFSIWITTAILMNSYRERLISAIAYWIILSIPLVYFMITYFYQFTLSATLTSIVELDPVTVSIILSAFLSLSKPIGGLIFGAAFWNIAKIVRYEKNIRSYMIISGWGIFLIFATNQAVTQMLTPYPPFGLATITVLNIGAYLMLLGIYNSATLVSANSSLRKSIHRHALESKLLNLIGHAEYEKEIQRTVGKIIEDKPELEMTTDTEYELDEDELKRYLDIVIKEVRKGEKLPES